METTNKEVFERYHQILNEIRWIKDVVELTNRYSFRQIKKHITFMKEYDFNKEESFEFLHKKLNKLIKELKQLKVALYIQDVEIIRDLKSTLWCGCSVKYQQEFMKNQESFMI